MGGRCCALVGGGVTGGSDGPLGVAAPSGGMEEVEGTGGRIGCTDVVADGLAGGASAALSVTRTVSRLSGMLEVFEVGVGGSEDIGIEGVCLGGRTAPVCLETGMPPVWRGGGICDVFGCGTSGDGGATAPGRIGGFASDTLLVCLDGEAGGSCLISGTLDVCLDGGAEPNDFASGTLAVCLEGGRLPTCRRSGTLVVNFDGGAGGVG